METEDLDKYLYGEDFKAAPAKQNEPAAAAEEDEYEDEEDFEIVLDSAKASEINKRSLTSVSISQDKNDSADGSKDSKNASSTPATSSVVHFDPFAPANLAGKMLYDHDLDSIEDKPWRKPGADLTDYFNYGFTESTWRAYCIKQRALRDEFGAQKKISVAGSGRPDDHHHRRDEGRPAHYADSRGPPADSSRYSSDPRASSHHDRHYDHPSSSSLSYPPSRRPRSPPPPPSRRVVRRDDDSRSPPPKRRRD